MQRRMQASLPWAGLVAACAAVAVLFVGPTQTDPVVIKAAHAVGPAVTHAITAQGPAWFLAVSGMWFVARVLVCLLVTPGLPSDWRRLKAILRLGALFAAALVAAIALFLPSASGSFGPLPSWLFIPDARACYAELVGFMGWSLIVGAWLEENFQ